MPQPFLYTMGQELTVPGGATGPVIARSEYADMAREPVYGVRHLVIGIMRERYYGQSQLTPVEPPAEG